MNIFKFFGNLKDNTSYKDERNIYVGNLNLDRIPAIDYEDIPGIFKRILHKRVDKLSPDNTKVIARFHKINDPAMTENIFKRVIALDEKTAALKLKDVMKEFSKRHKSIEEIFMRHFDLVESKLKAEYRSLSKEKKLLIGSLFTMEYSHESVSLFNPSVVLYPKQNDLEKGQLRVIFSFRATGEGHVSSIVFRSAVIEKNNDIYLEPISRYAATPQINLDPTYYRDHFEAKLKEINALDETAISILKNLPDKFSYTKLKEEIEKITTAQPTQDNASLSFSIKEIKWLALSNYEVVFPPKDLISERVIFPVSPTESNGIEDARFVRFRDDDGSFTYYATYTAYNGSVILPQLLKTKDFHNFKMSTLNGPFAKDKGMSLFPRKVNGKYAMLSRIDGENLYLMYSNNIYFWQEATKIVEPREPWEFIKIGNCGSPIETEEGWLVLTHGVGPMRKYCIGVVLLDLNDPSKVLGRLKYPLISPREHEREGYVPNVVYSCGSILLNDKLMIPYAASDSVSSIAVISLDELLGKLLKEK